MVSKKTFKVNTEPSSGSICGGNHGFIHTPKQYEEHIKLLDKNPYACIDCFGGIPMAFQYKRKELALMRKHFKSKDKK